VILPNLSKILFDFFCKSITPILASSIRPKKAETKIRLYFGIEKGFMPKSSIWKMCWRLAKAMSSRPSTSQGWRYHGCTRYWKNTIWPLPGKKTSGPHSQNFPAWQETGFSGTGDRSPMVTRLNLSVSFYILYPSSFAGINHAVWVFKGLLNDNWPFSTPIRPVRPRYKSARYLDSLVNLRFCWAGAQTPKSLNYFCANRKSMGCWSVGSKWPQIIVGWRAEKTYLKRKEDICR